MLDTHTDLSMLNFSWLECILVINIAWCDGDAHTDLTQTGVLICIPNINAWQNLIPKYSLFKTSFTIRVGVHTISFQSNANHPETGFLNRKEKTTTYIEIKV